MGNRIDLNADVGESLGPWPMGSDAALIPLVTSVNVACGFHAGDPLTMRRTVRLALDAGVAIGAHPGYPDLVGFGRRAMAMAPDDLEAAVLYQVAALAGIVRAEGGRLVHVKPHGALYHRLAADPAGAGAFARRSPAWTPTCGSWHRPGRPPSPQPGPSGCAAWSRASSDRAYEADGRLRSRDLPGSLHETPEAAAAQALAIARDAIVTARDGSTVPLRADTLCVHGDTPGAASMAAAIRAALAAAGIEVRSPDG